MKYERFLVDYTRLHPEMTVSAVLKNARIAWQKIQRSILEEKQIVASSIMGEEMGIEQSLKNIREVANKIEKLSK